MAVSLITFDYISEGKASSALDLINQINKEIPPVSEEQLLDTYEVYGNCYTALKQFSMAEMYYKKMLEINEKMTFENLFAADYNLINTMHISKTMCAFYLASKQYEKADYYLDKLFGLPRSFIKPVIQSKMHSMKFQVDSAFHRYSSAILHLSLHKKMNDSIFSEVQSGKIAELQTKYETEKTDQELAVLQSGQLVQSQQIHRALQAKIFIYAIVASLLATIGIGYGRYRFKQVTNATLIQQQSSINNQNHLLKQVLLQQQKLLSEKGSLVMEIHHRVKNNLQMMISLLNTQSEFVDNPMAQEAILESRERMHTMALIHRELTMLEKNTISDMSAYIHSMVSEIEARAAFRNRISFTIRLARTKVDISIAVLVALFLNETINHLFKYLNKHEVLSLTVELQLLPDGHLSLRVSGAPERKFDPVVSNSLNIQLMKLFAQQLSGTFNYDSEELTEISLTFPSSLILQIPPPMVELT